MDAIQRGASMERFHICPANTAQFAIRHHHGALTIAGNLTVFANHSAQTPSGCLI